MKFDSNLKGFEDFEKKMKDMPARTLKKVLRPSLSAVIKFARDQIRDAAPRHVDRQSPISKKFGPLYRNIKFKIMRKNRSGELGARVDTGNAPQGFWYEKGTRYQPARPWFEPKFRAISDGLLKMLGELIGKGIERVSEEK